MKKWNDVIDCYFPIDLASACRAEWSTGKSLRHPRAYQCYCYCYCYYCSYYIQKTRDQKHIEKCSGIPGVAYNFTNQNLVSFQESIGNKGDLPLVAYMNSETIASAQNFLTSEQNKTLIFAFHPKLNLNRVILQRSFGHSLLKLATVDYLTEDQIKFVGKGLINRLKDCVINVSERRCKNTVAQMFAVELRFLSNCLLKWFNGKFKIQNVEIDHKEKVTYEVFNPIDWKKKMCYLKLSPDH